MPSQVPLPDNVAKRLPNVPTVEVWIVNKIINHSIKTMKGSWLPKLTGLTSLLTLVGNAATMLLDGNPATNPDWSIFFPAMTAAIGLIFARQNSVTSEDAGATKKW